MHTETFTYAHVDSWLYIYINKYTSVFCRKFIQVEVKGNHQTAFSLTKPHLKTVDNNDVDFTYLGHFDKWQVSLVSSIHRSW